MTPERIGALVNSAIPLVGGVVAAWLSYADGPLAGAYEISVSDCKDGGVAPR